MTPKKKGRPRIHPISHKKGGTRGSDSNNGTPTVDTQLRKRLRLLYRCLMDHVQDDGRQPILVFMEKPSKKLYPDYYRVIAEPIDMVTIDSNIKNDRYISIFHLGFELICISANIFQLLDYLSKVFYWRRAARWSSLDV